MSVELPASASTPRPRLGFIGLGWIGGLRLQSVAAEDVAEIAALYDPVAENVRRLAGSAPKAMHCSSVDALLDMELDGVVIATPSALHADQTIRALKKGTPVFCQKPLARTSGEVRRIVATAREASLLLAVDMSYRWTEGLRQIRELAMTGTLGHVFAAELVFHNAYGPQSSWFYDMELSGGGCMMDLGIHLLDAALWILQSPVKSLSSRLFTGGRRLGSCPAEVEDFGSARLDLESGASVNLSCSWRMHAGREAVIEAAFYGTKGGAAMRNVRGSFVDFQTERFTGTKVEVMSTPPDAWGGRAVTAWVRRLALQNSFDPEVEQLVPVAEALDAIYGRPVC